MDQLSHDEACATLWEKIPNACPLPGGMGGLGIDIAINKSLRPVPQCVFNELTSVFLCVCPLIDDKLRHNIVKVAVEPRAAAEWFRSKLWQCYDEIYHQ